MRNIHSKFDPATGILFGLSFLVMSALFVGGKGALLRMAIPAAASCIGLSLYFRRPATYVEFALWTWFLTPLLRRVVDWRVGFADHNLILVAPFLVSSVSILTLRQRSLTAARPSLTPFVLCGVAIGYGFLIGMALHPSGEVIYGLVDWLSPMLLGLHLYLRWEEFEANSAAVRRAALWGLLIMGAYGIFQFYRPPVWDTEWLTNLPGGVANSTFGRPEPQAIRVWSTLNAPGPFGNVVIALLFLLAPVQSKLKAPAIAAGLYSLLLSLVRTAWITGAIGMLYLAMISNRKLFLKVFIGMGAAVIGLMLLVNSPLDIPILQNRFKSLTDLKHDESLQDRTRLYEGLSGEVLSEPVGIGLNNLDFYHGYPLDSGFIRMMLSLGWFGTITFSVGIVQLLIFMGRGRQKNNVALASCTTITVIFILQLASGLTFVSSSGAMFWIAAGLGLASRVPEAEVRRRQSSVSWARAMSSNARVHSPSADYGIESGPSTESVS